MHEDMVAADEVAGENAAVSGVDADPVEQSDNAEIDKYMTFDVALRAAAEGQPKNTASEIVAVAVEAQMIQTSGVYKVN